MDKLHFALKKPNGMTRFPNLNTYKRYSFQIGKPQIEGEKLEKGVEKG